MNKMAEENKGQISQPRQPAQQNQTGQTASKVLKPVDGFLEDLFDNNNECITRSDGTFPVKEDTRHLLALFSDGSFIVSDTHKFDGRVLSFEVIARKRKLKVAKPQYVPLSYITAIYDKASRLNTSSFVSVGDDEQLEMQRDFIALIERAAASKVSDIHIVIGDYTTILFRYNGLMNKEIEHNKEWGEAFARAAFASSDISDSNYAQNEYQAAQKSGQTPLRGSKGKLMLPRNVLGVRLQFNPIAFGTRYLVMRLLYADERTNFEEDNLSSSGFNSRELDIFYKMRSYPMGVNIIAGPTGSGKSTTLQKNMINMLEERKYEINLITVEDPPEYPIPGARQMPVTNATTEELKEREFTKALSAALRSDPDSLMIGEIRTLSAAQLAFQGALSGHNVWTTLHANSAPAILMRLRDMGVDDYKLIDPELIKGLISQRLFRKVCPHCRIPASDQLQHPSVVRLKRVFGEFGLDRSFLRGPGCEHCGGKGILGRIAIAEIVIPDATFLELLIKGETKKGIDYWISELEGRTLKENAIERMLLGIIDIEEIERWTGLLDLRPVY